MLVLLLSQLCGCPGFGKVPLDDGSGTVPDAPTYDEHVGAILDNYCAPCHTVPPQNGAPDDFRLDQYADDGDLSGAASKADRIAERAGGSNASMPPSGNTAPTQVERDTLAAWVADGAPEAPPSDTGPDDSDSAGGYQ